MAVICFKLLILKELETHIKVAKIVLGSVYISPFLPIKETSNVTITQLSKLGSQHWNTTMYQLIYMYSCVCMSVSSSMKFYHTYRSI